MRWFRAGSTRRWWSVLVALTLVSLLAACGSTSGGGGGGSGNSTTGPKNALNQCPGSTNTSAASAESGNITLNVAGWSSTPAEDTLVQQGFTNFHNKYPNITVKWTVIPGDYPTKMRANVASGNVPDVFYVQPPQAQEYIKAGKLLNLGPYMARDNVASSAFYPSLMTPFDCADGTIFGIPKDWNSLGLFYNTAMFQAAGIGDPSNWTWTDLQTNAQKLTKGNVKGVVLSADASRWGAFLYGAGGSMLSSDGKTATFNSQAGIDSLTYYTSFEKSKTGIMPSDTGAGWNGEAFGKQQAAIAFEGGWMIPYMQQTFPSVQYKIAPMPMSASGKRGNLLYTNAWGAYSGTKHADAAWKLIQYMTGADFQGQVLRDGFALPTIQSLANDPYFTENPGVKVLQDGAADGTADFYGPADSQIHTQVSNAIQSVMLGKSDVKSALDSAKQTVDTWIQQNVGP